MDSMTKTYTLTVTLDDLPLIGEALGAMPFGRVADLMGRILEQINEQDKEGD
jgi:hypothetical protein